MYRKYISSGPVYTYHCRRCGQRASKPSVEEANGALGHWRCPRCGPTSVTRRRVREGK